MAHFHSHGDKGEWKGGKQTCVMLMDVVSLWESGTKTAASAVVDLLGWMDSARRGRWGDFRGWGVSKQVAETWLILPVSCGHLSNYYLCCWANLQSRAANSGEKSSETLWGSRHPTSITQRHGAVSLRERGEERGERQKVLLWETSLNR